MAVITRSNSLRMIGQLDYKGSNKFKGAVYEKALINHWFNGFEKNSLIGFRKFLESPEEFVSNYFRPVVNKDTKTYVYEGGKPAYHKDRNCERLSADYINYLIPIQIREKGDKEISEYRIWFKRNQDLFRDNVTEYVKQVEIRYKIVIDPKSIEQKNSGTETQKNHSLNELEDAISQILQKSEEFYHKCDYDKKRAFLIYQPKLYLCSSPKLDENNYTELSTEVLRTFLTELDAKFKSPLIEYILAYHMVKLNPTLTFDGPLLEQLNFKRCSSCF